MVVQAAGKVGYGQAADMVRYRQAEDMKYCSPVKRRYEKHILIVSSFGLDAVGSAIENVYSRWAVGMV